MSSDAMPASEASATPPVAPARDFPAREAIERTQLRKLAALIKAVLPANAFYTRKLGIESLGWSPGNYAEFSQRVGFTTKHELIRDRLEHPPYGTGLTFPVDAYVRCHQTSGTTTVPIRWLDTAESWAHIVDNWVQILRAAGVTTLDRFFFAFSLGPFIGFWSALEAVNRFGCFCFPGGAMSSPARLQAILDNRITAVCCTPTYAQHLGEVARERKIDLSRGNVRLLVVAGEAGGSIPATRARIERLWPGARVFDHHGMTEVGPVTYQCPAQPGVLHVLESAYLPEVINRDTNAPAMPGQTGELVLTTLDRIGSPLLRYRTGDLVKPRKPGACVCGRHELALEGGIIGRSDDMVIIRGVNVYPSLIEEIVRTADVSEYRVRVDGKTAMRELVVDIEPAAACSDPTALQQRLELSLQSALNLRVPVRLLPSGTLPRFEMKAQRWIKSAA